MNSTNMNEGQSLHPEVLSWAIPPTEVRNVRSGYQPALRSSVNRCSKFVVQPLRCHLAPVITVEGGERVGRTAARARHVNSR